MMVIMAGVLMTAVDTTIVVLALPEIQRSLHVALTDVVWVIISFLLVITLLVHPGGQARRHVRPGADVRDRLRGLRPRLAAVRAGLGRGVDHRRSGSCRASAAR